jgi:hypothetical protein
MCTNWLRIRGMDVHQQTKNKRDRYVPAGLEYEGQMCTSRLRIRGTDVHQLDKEERDRCAPAG